MKKKIIFRADGNSTIGMGHMYRLLSLAEIVKQNYDFIFVTKEPSSAAIIPKSYNKIIIPKAIHAKKEIEWLGVNFSPEKHIIIADGYQFSSTYQKKIKIKKYQLIYIDDIAAWHMYADIVINHSLYVKKNHYSKESYTKLVLGANYALLRPLFLEESKRNRQSSIFNTAFICFGGADPYDLSLKSAKALLQIPQFTMINIVLGAAYPHKEIYDLKQKHNDKISIHCNLSEKELIIIMQQCNFAIAPSSTILYEICCVKMPVLSGFYTENQELFYKGLAESQIVYQGDNFSAYTILNFKDNITKVLQQKNSNSFLANQHRLFDGKSKSRLLGVINKLNISFRKAEQCDLVNVYNWSNDEITRQNSYKSDTIEFKNHKKWFTRKISDKNTLFLIVLVNDISAGIIRFELKEYFSLIGITISKEFRGQKLSSDFIIMAAKYYFKSYNAPILAYIKKENIASTKAFKKAGYTYFKDEVIKGYPSYIYKLRKENVKR